MASNRSPKGTRRRPTLVPLTAQERQLLLWAALAAGKPLATWIRDTCLTAASGDSRR